MTAYNMNVWPPMTLPAVQSTTKSSGIAAAPSAPPQKLPEPTETRVIDFAPTTAPQVVTTYVRPVVTAALTRSLFGIVDGSNVVPNPAPIV
jgi:hypothetical protein